jgi:hypothetical protein
MRFEEWVLTDNGRQCVKWPVTDEIFLRNRLWWAFQAGAESGAQEYPTDTSTVKSE